jgi:hypothetical protein
LGHQFRAFPYNVIQGYWCRICAGLEIDGMSEAAILASERGGKCLSEQYLNAREPLEWICKDGHVWKAPLNEVKRGRWCKKCWDLKQVVQYNPYAIAVDRGGKCLSPRYEHTNQMLEWECDQGHRWHAPIFRVLRGAWCKECFKEGRLQGIERFQFIAKYKRGECLSTTYTAGAPMDFRCHKGHLWKATSTEMLRGRWCPVCTYETGVQR